MNLKNDILDRIEFLVGDRSLKKAASDWGIPQATLQTMLKSRSDPKFDNIDKIIKAENVNVEWLLSGIEQEDDFITIPKIEIDVSAGNGSLVVSENVSEGMKVTRQWLLNEGFEHSKLVMLTARGDSMEPSIPNGASLIVDKCHASFKDEDGIFVLRIGESLFVKRLRYDHLNYELSIISDNPIYPVTQVKANQLNDICVIGKVVKLVVDL